MRGPSIRVLLISLLASSASFLSCAAEGDLPRVPIVGPIQRPPPRQSDPEVQYAPAPTRPPAPAPQSWVYVSAEGEWVYTANLGWIWLPPGRSVGTSVP